MGEEVLRRLQLGLGLLLIGRLKEVGQGLRRLEELWGYRWNVLKVILHCIRIVGNLLYHCSGHSLIQNLLGLHYI